VFIEDRERAAIIIKTPPTIKAGKSNKEFLFIGFKN